MGSELGLTDDTMPEIRLDSVGIWWITWASVWTFLLICGMAYLIHRRDTPIVRIRGIGLSLGAVVLLHLYYFTVQIGYVIGPVVPGDCEYWIMGTYLPLGIGMFQASNCRFLYVAQAQKKYLNRLSTVPVKSRKTTGLLDRYRNLGYTRKMLSLIGMGMILQLLLTVLMWMVSRKWHPTWGVAGTEVVGTEMQQKVGMGLGWEWWPGIFWQVIWAWFVAPYILWKSRNINDTHGWRTQTIGCAVAGLQATPMWLISLYVPAMEPINRYFLPPQWICLSIFALEILTVFLPCWQVMRVTNLRQDTLNSIAQWENKSKVAKLANSKVSAVNTAITGRKSTSESIRTTDSGESILTMSALEYVLERNPTPLQEFSSLRDFSGENIAFLTCVAAWKASLPEAVRSGIKDTTTRELVRERFNGALRVYAQFISIKDAEFPINISSTELKKLETIFESSARVLYGEKNEVDSATPFDFPECVPKTSEASSAASGSNRPSVTDASDGVQFWGEIPESFDESVFDEAEQHIKYLVLTNTWPKFVKDRRTSFDLANSAEKGRSIMSMIRNRHR